MAKIFSMTATPLDSALNITLYALSYLLVTSAVHAIGVSLCMYIDHHRRIRLSTAVTDEEKIVSGEGGMRDLSEEEARTNLPEAKNDKAAPPPSHPHPHQTSTRQLLTDQQSSTHINKHLPLPSSNCDATTPLRTLDKRSKSNHTSSDPAAFPQRPTTKAATHVPNNFTKYGTTEAAS